MSTFSAATILFLVMDPLGNIPLFQSILRPFGHKQQKRIILREALISFGVLLIFLLIGRRLLALLSISESSISIAGGIILFIIALKMIFSSTKEMFESDTESEPFIVPLAIPLQAGPSAMATVMLLSSQEPDKLLNWTAALLAACALSTTILFFSSAIAKFLGQRCLIASEKLMGLLLTAIAVQSLQQGIREFIQGL